MAFSGAFVKPFRPAFDAGGAAAAGALAPVAGSWLWLKADAISGSDGDAVTTWSDSSTNGRNFDGTGHAPTLKTNIINGLSVVRNTASAYLLLASALPATNTVHLVASLTTAPVPGVGFAGFVETNLTGQTKSSTPWFVVQTTAARLVRTMDNSTFQNLGTATLGAPFRVTMTHNSTTSKRSGWWNGASVYTDATYGKTGSNQQINLFVGYNDYVLGDIAEVIIYNSALSAPDLATNEAYLTAKYAIT